LRAGKFPAAQKIVGGMFLNQEKMVFARILVSMVMSRGLFDRCRQESVGVQIQKMERGDAKEKGKPNRRSLPEICDSCFHG